MDDLCMGKRIYSKREAAEVRNRRSRGEPNVKMFRRGEHRRRLRSVPDNLRIYQCNICNGWHLTSSDE